MKLKLLLAGMTMTVASQTALAQHELYPHHFDLEQVTLLDGPMKTAMDLNIQVLMQYDVDRLLTPFVRQAGLASTIDKDSKYYQWVTKHPNFRNWGDSSFDLSGHVGGHYLSALALAYAATHDDSQKSQLKARLDYMIGVLKDCQDQYDGNTKGLYGFIGGQPINSDWTALFSGNISPLQAHGGWVPFYCQHKILAGLRDAYLYGDSDVAKELFRKLADWSVNVVAKVSDSNMETLLNIEHGGMNESMLDAYQLFGDAKYLTAAKKYTHKSMLNGMQTLNQSFLDGKHANTQVPKYIGMERIGEADGGSTAYLKAAENFWQDVAQNRTVCIGGNSVNEHFLAAANANRYIDQLDGPESCNTNNMLKLSEMMADRTRDARYADFYEYAVWNHILSTQDPTTGGYVYFTTLRPQGYRIYSQPNQGMWCCVGTGMENHSKYGHFIYTRDETSKTLYVNLFTPSRLESDDYVITQTTGFPYEQQTTLTVGKAGNYTIAFRHPAWAGKGFAWSVNDEKANDAAEQGRAYYIKETRDWQVGDQITIQLPMDLKLVECPNYTDYVAFTYGPILLGANVSAKGELLPNEYGGEGRMDHSPGSMASAKNLLSAPLLIGPRDKTLSRIRLDDAAKLRFTIDARREGVETYRWDSLALEPFYQIHHARYMCYWYQQTEENFAQSSMARTEAEAEAMQRRTLDFVAPGEQQSEAGHEYQYSSDSNKGNYNGESYRDAQKNGYVQYTLYNKEGLTDSLAVLCRFTTADQGRKASLSVDGTKIADVVVAKAVKNSDNGFYNMEYTIPAELLKGKDGKPKTSLVVRLAANAGTLNPGLYYLRLMRSHDPQAHAYRFRATDWTTGDGQRIAQANITYDNEQNVIRAKRTGVNNIALTLNYQNRDYVILLPEKYLVVRGKNLGTADGQSYLWWLNGVNHGSQVKPSVQKTIEVEGKQQTLIAWDMSTSGLYENITGDHPCVCLGQTIFGLTSTAADGSCEIYDISFATSVANYQETLSVRPPLRSAEAEPCYQLTGISADQPSKGIYIKGGRKYVK